MEPEKARDNPFRPAFWMEAKEFLPDADVLLAFFSSAVILSCVAFWCYTKLFNNNLYVFLGVFALLILLGNYICYWISKREHHKSSNVANLEECRACVEQYDNDSFFLAQYGLIKAQTSHKHNTEQVSLQTIEEGLEGGDEIIIYTSCEGSAPGVLDIVRANKERGVRYKLVCYGTEKLSEDDKSLYEALVCLPISEKSVDSQFAKSKAGIDLFSFKRKRDGVIEAYFAVNYSVREAGENSCPRAAYGTCPPVDQYYVDNKYLFYKRLDRRISEAVFATLSGVIAREQRRRS